MQMIKKFSTQSISMDKDVLNEIGDEEYNFNDYTNLIKKTNDNVKFFKEVQNADIQNLIRNNFLTKEEYDQCLYLYKTQNKDTEIEIDINEAIEKFDKIYVSSDRPINKSYFSQSEHLELQILLLQLSNFMNKLYNNFSIIMEKTYFCDIVNEILEFDKLISKMRKPLCKVRILSSFNEHFDMEDNYCLTPYLNDIDDINNELSKLYNVKTQPESFSIKEFGLYKDSVSSPIKNFDKIYVIPTKSLEVDENLCFKDKFRYKNIFNKPMIPIKDLSDFNTNSNNVNVNNKRKLPVYIYKSKRKTNEDYIEEDAILERRKRMFEGSNDSIDEKHKKMRIISDTLNVFLKRQNKVNAFRSVFSMLDLQDEVRQSEEDKDDNMKDEEIIYENDNRLNSIYKYSNYMDSSNSIEFVVSENNQDKDLQNRQIEKFNESIYADFNESLYRDLDEDLQNRQIEKFNKGLKSNDLQINNYNPVITLEDYEDFNDNTMDTGNVHADQIFQDIVNKTIDTAPGTSKKPYWKLK